MENHTHDQVLASGQAPYLTDLVRTCGTATRWGAVGAPSLPNYLAMTSGSKHDVTDDADPAHHPIDADNLYRQVRDAGGTARAYVEGMPVPCAQVSSGKYAAKHNPAAYFAAPTDRAACRTDDVPLTALADDLRTGALPRFATITPDLCNDMHDCDVATGDAFAAAWLPRLLDSAAYRKGTMAVVVAWDENTPVPNVVIAPTVPTGTVVATPVDHYELLRTTEEMLGIDTFLGEADNAHSLRAAFRL
jgi:phospholipase C